MPVRIWPDGDEDVFAVGVWSGWRSPLAWEEGKSLCCMALLKLSTDDDDDDDDMR